MRIPQLPLAIASQFCSAPRGFTGGKSYVYVQRVSDTHAEVIGTDGHIAVTVSFAVDGYNIPADLIAIPQGMYCKKPDDTAVCTIDVSPDSITVSTVTKKGTTTETLKRHETALTVDNLQAIKCDPTGCLSTYKRVTLDPKLLGRICKAADKSTVTIARYSAAQPNVYTWAVDTTPSLPGGAECIALLMPICVHNPSTDDPHDAYDVVARP